LDFNASGAGGVTDDAGNISVANKTGDQTFTIDKTLPTVTSINRNGTTPTNGASVIFTVTFNENVSGIATGDFTLVDVSTSITAELFDTNTSGTAIKLPTYKGTTPLINVTSGNYPAPQPTDYDYLDNLIGILGYSSASIFYKSPWITLGGSPANKITTAPASKPDIASWDKPAINKTGEIVYKVDFEGYSPFVANDFISRPPTRQTEFVTQSFAVQFTEPAPYDVKLQNENSSVVYRVSGEVELNSTATLINAYRGTYALTNKSTGFTGAQIDAYGSSSYEYQCTVEIVSKSDHITLANGTLYAGVKLPGLSTSASMAGVTAWSNPESNPTAEIVYGINCEGRQTIFKTQSLSVQFEGAVGPGIVMRGEWSQAIDYIGQVETTNKRRDAVTYLATSDTVKYYASVSGSGPATLDGNSGTVGYHAPTANGTNAWWEYLGEQDFFVAAKIAIFEESYVKNTINVGTKDGTSGFANIVLAGGRPDPYMAIGQNTTVGTAGTSGTTNTTGVIGYNKPGIFLGIYEAGTAGTTGRFSIKTTGTSGKGMSWDGDTLTIVGSIRQVEPGVSEGSLRGAWTSGFTYYTNDIVSYGGQSWRCTSAQAQSYQHIATNDTAALTGYPGSGPWAVAAAAGSSGTAGSGGTAGTAGGPGPGVVYRGDWAQFEGDGTTAKTYTKTTERTDVVKGSDNAYYIAKSTHTTAAAAGGTSTRPIDGASYSTYWQSFGATFSSVATGLLLAENATITKGLVIGQDGTEIGFIRSAQANSIIAGDGFYIDANGSVRFGDDTSTVNGKYVYWNGADLNIKGTINISDGSVGGWVVDTEAAGGSLHDSNDRIVFNPSIPEVQMYDTSAKLKVQMSPKDTLTDTSVGGNKYITDLDSSLSAAASTTSNSGNNEAVYSAYSTNTPCTAFTIAAGEVGTYEVNSIYSIPQILITTTGLPATTATTSYPTYPVEYPWQSHSGYAYKSNAIIYLYMEFVNSSNVVIHRQELNYASAYGASTQPTYYYAQEDPYNLGTYDWVSSPGYSSAASFYRPTQTSPYSFQVNFATAGNYTIRYSTRIVVTSGKADNAESDGSRTYSYTQATKAGLAFSSTLDSNLDLIYPANFVEITAGGFQAVTDSTQYIKIIREASGGTNPTLMRVQGGQVVIQHTDTAQVTLSNNAVSQLYGKAILGTDWSSDLTKPATTILNGGLQLGTRYTHYTGGSSTSPVRLAPGLSSGYTLITLRNGGGTSYHFQLPYYVSETYKDDDYLKFEPGHMVVLFNSDDNTSCQIRGLYNGLTTSTSNGYNELAGGVCWILFYGGSSASTINASRSYHWILASQLDNNF
jgi:hypothetical protein